MACTGCGVGTYSAQRRANSSAACLACKTGTYSTQMGTVQCTPCSVGTYGVGTGAEPKGVIPLNAARVARIAVPPLPSRDEPAMPLSADAEDLERAAGHPFCLVIKRSARAHYLHAANADELGRWMAALCGGGSAGAGGGAGGGR